MRKLLLVFGVLGLSAIPARAQKLELFGGYSYAQIDPGGQFTQTSSGKGRHFGVSGWNASVAGNMNNWFGVVFDFSGYAGTSDVEGIPEHGRFNTFMAGPQLTFRKLPLVDVFAHGLVGGMRSRVAINNPGFSPTVSEATKLGWAVGGGLDVKLSSLVAWRAIQADYFGSSFNDLNQLGTAIKTHQANGRVSTGLVLRF